MNEDLKDNNDSKEKPNYQEIIKVYFSSLFARRMKYLVMTNDVFIYTTIQISRTTNYRPRITLPKVLTDGSFIGDYIHKIEWFDTTDRDLLYERFPVFKDNLVIVDMPKLYTMYNKHPDDIEVVAKDDKLLLQLNGELIRAKKSKVYVSDEDTPKDVEFEDLDYYCVGRIIEDYQLECYYDIMEQIDREPLFEEHKKKFSDMVKNQVNYFVHANKLDDDFQQADWTIHIPLFDGITNISYNEYVKKLKDRDEYLNIRLSLLAPNVTDSIQVVCIYETKDIRVTSYQPASIFFKLHVPRPEAIKNRIYGEPVLDTL